jgi:DNA-binding response OmpR family regulator
VLRRRQRGRDDLPVVAAGPYRLNTVHRCLSRLGAATRVDLTATETVLIAHLMAHAGSPVHRSDLAHGAAWTPDDRATDVHVSHIRRKLAQAEMSGFSIQPVRGYGYRLALATDESDAGDGTTQRLDA